MGDLVVRRGVSLASDPRTAVQEVARSIQQPDASATFLFASSRYDLDRLGPAIAESFRGPVLACTTAGELTPRGYAEGTLTGASISSDGFVMKPLLIEQVRQFGPRRADEVGQSIVRTAAEEIARMPGADAFGILLVDGMSEAEDGVAGYLGNAMGRFGLVGGSAGDDLRFETTHVYHDGRFVSDAALLGVCVTTHPFALLKTQHFEPTETKLVVTGARSSERIVTEIDGERAASAYARHVGVLESDLGPDVYSRHPVMVKVGGQYFVRSIQKANPDGSFKFYSAIDEGIVLTLARGVDMVKNLQQAFEASRAQVASPQLVIGFECILRRLEIKQRGLEDVLGDVMVSNGVVGFNTYGEQYGSIHVNQTFTGLSLGR